MSSVAFNLAIHILEKKNWDDLYTYLRLLESLEMKFHGVNREHQKLIPFETYSEDCQH